MDDFSRSLRGRLETALGHAPPWGDVNPLITIGLTEAMLDLRLNEDQMYAVVRSYARQLASQIHPDRQQTNVSETRSRQIIEAFDILDDRKNFSRAWEEFRHLKAQERNESNALRKALTSTKEQVRHYQDREQTLKDQERKLAQARTVFERKQREVMDRIPGLQAEKERLERLYSREENVAGRYRQRYLDYKEYVNRMCVSDPESLSIFNAKWIAVAVLVGKPMKTASSGNSEKIDPVLGEVFRKLRVPDQEVNKIFDQWVSAQKQFGKPLPSKEGERSSERNSFVLDLHILKVKKGLLAGVYGKPKPPKGSFLLGSVPPHRLDPEKKSLDRGHISGVLDQDTVFRNLVPTLAPGGLLVLQYFVRWHTDYLRNPEWPITNRQTERVILGAG